MITGVYPQRLRVTRRDVPEDIARELDKGATAWRAKLTGIPANTTMEKVLKDYVDYYERELAALRKRWPAAVAGAQR